jgi:hypothetical protein
MPGSRDDSQKIHLARLQHAHSVRRTSRFAQFGAHYRIELPCGL